MIKELVTAFRKEPWWHLLKNSCIFVLHFMVVMLLLCCAAFVLAKLEDPDIMNNNEQQQELSMDGNSNVSFVVTANNTREENRSEILIFSRLILVYIEILIFNKPRTNVGIYRYS